MQAPWVSISPYEPYLRSHIEEAAKLQVSDSVYVSRMDMYVVSVHVGLVVPMPVNLSVCVCVCHCVVRRMAFLISVFVYLSLARTLACL
jgi:hypothetical protein